MSRTPLIARFPAGLRRAAAGLAAAGAGLALVVCAARADLWLGEGNGVPPGYSPKDFTILQVDGLFHVFYIMSNPALRTNSTALHLNERRFGHAVSTDLATWTFVDSSFTVDPISFDRHHVWSPSVVRADGRFWMFYTGVEDSLIGGSWVPRHMRVGLAWSNDLVSWQRSKAPILECGGPNAPWADCAQGGVRDAFVAWADTSGSGGSSWWMFYSTQPSSAPTGYYDPLAFLVGAAAGVTGDLTAWSDFGPNWSTYRTYQNPPSERTNKVESPHVFRHGNNWYLFFTGDLGIAYLTGSTPVGDIPVHRDEWTYHGSLDEISPTEFASEAFRATWADGSTEDYFATVRSLGSYRYGLLLRIFDPVSGGPMLADPLTLSEIRPLALAVSEGETLPVWMHAELPSMAGTFDQVLTRPAPLEVFEVDDSLGVRRMTRIDPESVGIPSVPKVTTWYQGGDLGDTLVFLPTWIPDDDDTPDRIEIVIRFRGVESPVIAIARAGTPVTAVGDAGSMAPGLRAASRPGRVGATLDLDLPAATHAVLDLYDVRGRRVRSLLDRGLAAGSTRVEWDGRDANGVVVAPGVIFARLRAGGHEAVVRVSVIH